jgi:hypothetical protein
MKKNPFILTPMIPEEFFCDRETETQFLIKALTNQSNVVLTSARRMGKTGLINHCFEQPAIKDHFITIPVDILHTTSLSELILELGKAVFKVVAKKSDRMLMKFVAALRSLNASFGYNPLNGTPTFNISLGQITAPELTLDEIFDYLEDAEKPCIVAIDEFQQITHYVEKNVEAQLRGKIQRLKNTYFIFAGSERRIMNEMFFSSKRPFYQSASLLQLEPIALDKYTAFVTHHFAEEGKSVDKDAVMQVYNKWNGVTMYMHRIFHDAFIEVSQGETCTLSVIDQVTDSYIAQNEKRLQELLAFITVSQKEVLYAIAREGVVTHLTSAAFVKRNNLKSASAVQSAVKQLLDYDIITLKGREFSISDPLLAIWLKSKMD